MTATGKNPSVQLTEAEIDRLILWPDQPRQILRQNAAEDAELLASVKAHGVLQTLIVRPAKDNKLQIIAGERRYHAAKAAGLKVVPVSVRDLDDTAARTVALTENIQRRNMHPLDEADAIAELMKVQTLKTPQAVAAHLGLPEVQIRRRLRFQKLAPTVREAFVGQALTAQHAETLATLSHTEQVKALPRCYFDLFDEAHNAIPKKNWAVLKDHVAPIGQLREYMRRNVVMDITHADVQEDFPEIGALMATPEGKTALLLSDGYYSVPNGLRDANHWREASGKGSKKCAYAQTGVVVHGGVQRVLTVCVNEKCATHWPERQRSKTAGMTPAEVKQTAALEAADRKRRQQASKFQNLRRSAWPEITKAVVANVRVNASLVKEVLSDYAVKEITDRVPLKLSDETAPAFLALHVIVRHQSERGRFQKALKPYRFDLAKFEKQLKSKRKSTAKVIKAERKTARKAGKK